VIPGLVVVKVVVVITGLAVVKIVVLIKIWSDILGIGNSYGISKTNGIR
jgi:hypothetical protein